MILLQGVDISKMEELRDGVSFENLQVELPILSLSLVLEFNALILQAVLGYIEGN